MESRKCYISSQDAKRALYKNNIMRQYQFLIVEELKKADLVCVPKEITGLTKEQSKDLMAAKELGLDIRITNAELILSAQGLDSDFLCLEKDFGLSKGQRQHSLELEV